MNVIAFDRRTPAQEVSKHRRAWRVDDGYYEVISRSGDERYGVTLHPSGELSCTCTAGRFGNHCWHVQKVADRLLRDGVPSSVLDDRDDDLTPDDGVWGAL